MKLWERVIETRIRKETHITLNQFGFMPESLEDKGVPGKYVSIIKDMYVRSETSVRAPVGDTDFFAVEVGLHQGSVLSPFLFTIMLDELSRSIQETIPWRMLFADDIVLVAETKQRLNSRLEEWRAALEGKGLRISRSKTEYLYCNFSGAGDGDDTQITMCGHGVRRTECWSIKKAQARKMDVAEMRMLRWMYGHTRLDRIRNEDFRERLGVANISDKIKEGRLRWFEHVKRRQLTTPVRVVEGLIVEGRRS
ncbi:uncharacterized protein LOC118488194 [Helianthus annuus]|uniref:uncharacterized protein LOC118488194 n=1 Tax=Helianthus annuus TaxID=4232 RepID=UPI00165333FC|nr:uncharacterized protein LOC118488194 [Helianthus annuus]